MGICAFCDLDKKLTREHVFPDFIEKKREKEGLYYSACTKKYLSSAPVVKDVCEECNNVHLSNLDNYASMLFDKFFTEELLKVKNIKFERELLVRWLLKVLYNSARSFKTVPQVFYPYKKFMIGNAECPKRVYLLSCVMKSGWVNGEEVKARDIRVSDLRLPEMELGVQFSLCHAVTINSYSIILISFLGSPSEKAINRTFKFLKQEIGCELERKYGELRFNPNASKIDHVSHKGCQRINNPWLYPNEGIIQIGKQKLQLTGFPEHDMSRVSVVDSKMQIVSLGVGQKIYPLICSENVPHGLEEFSSPIEEAILIKSSSSRASAEIVRKRNKTYITVHDLLEPDEPFSSVKTGTVQSEDNWAMWKGAIVDEQRIYMCKEFNIKKPNETVVYAVVKVEKVIEQP
ncbi:hypothetical protein G6329_17405 [Vibrio cholerae]|uniref:hypothetical protein n=1 Tax=Vibrio TaxID=662 RepID=UPI0011D6FDBE|nr:hypothetical protein [Vibrio mimicus]EKF9975245.1 hypothetical protein [Vibrio cholerae]TXZ74197.1 hypothetical protein FXE51_16595 [Vibrio mimicus]